LQLNSAKKQVPPGPVDDTSGTDGEFDALVGADVDAVSVGVGGADGLGLGGPETPGRAFDACCVLTTAAVPTATAATAAAASSGATQRALQRELSR
jgi:hypothetical protein